MYDGLFSGIFVFGWIFCDSGFSVFCSMLVSLVDFLSYVLILLFYAGYLSSCSLSCSMILLFFDLCRVWFFVFWLFLDLFLTLEIVVGFFLLFKDKYIARRFALCRRIFVFCFPRLGVAKEEFAAASGGDCVFLNFVLGHRELILYGNNNVNCFL